MIETIKLTYQKHVGTLFISTNNVKFYGREFENISEAVKSLKHLTPGEKYFAWFYNFHEGFLHEKTGQIFLEGRWLPNEDFAEKYIDTKKK